MNWIIIRGLSREIRHWHTFPLKLKTSTENINVFPLELPGAGTKNQIKVPQSINGFTSHLRKEWLELKNEFDGPWGIIAISLGGMIAMDWCSNYEDDFKHIVIINSSAKGICNITERISIEAIKKISQIILIKDTIQREKKILDLTTNTLEDPIRMSELFGEYSKQYPIGKISFIKQMISAMNFNLPTKLIPKLSVLTSKQDKFVSYRCSEKINKHFGGTIHYHESAGHDLPLDDPEWIINIVKKLI